MSFLLRYFMIVLACLAMLAGIQLPNLADQYGKRLDAHLREVTVNFLPFQEIANQQTNGSIATLIDMHRRSNVPALRAEGGAIEGMYQRKQRFEAEFQALQAALPMRLLHILVRPDREILDETVAQYSATVPLNQEALVAGAVAALAALMLVELMLGLMRRLNSALTRWLNHRWRGA